MSSTHTVGDDGGPDAGGGLRHQGTAMSPCLSDVLTVVGVVVGVASLVLTGLIYRWTATTDGERHAELLETVREIANLLPAGQPANLGQLTHDEQAKLQAALLPDEFVFHIARAAAGKGNNPWRALTSAKRVLTVYTGGRKGGVYVRELT